MFREKQRYHIIYIFGTLVGTLLASVAAGSACQYGLSVEVPDCSLEGITCLNEANNLFEDGNFSRGNDAWVGSTVVPDGLQVDIGFSLTQSVYTPCAGEYVITLEVRTDTSVLVSCGATGMATRLIEGESCPDFMVEGNTEISYAEDWKIYQCKVEQQEDNNDWTALVYVSESAGGDDSTSLIFRYAHLLMLPSTTCVETATPTSTPSPSSTPTSTSIPSASITSWKTITSSPTTTVTMTPSTSTTSMSSASSTSSPMPTKTASPTQTRTSTITSSPTATVTMTSSTSGASMPSASSTSSPMPTKISSPTQTRTSTTTHTGSETMTSKSLPSSSVTTTPSPSATCSYTQPNAPTSTHTASKTLAPMSSPQKTSSASASNNETFSSSHLATSTAMWTANEVSTTADAERTVTPTVAYTIPPEVSSSPQETTRQNSTPRKSRYRNLPLQRCKGSI